MIAHECHYSLRSRTMPYASMRSRGSVNRMTTCQRVVMSEGAVAFCRRRLRTSARRANSRWVANHETEEEEMGDVNPTYLVRVT